MNDSTRATVTASLTEVRRFAGTHGQPVSTKDVYRVGRPPARVHWAAALVDGVWTCYTTPELEPDEGEHTSGMLPFGDTDTDTGSAESGTAGATGADGNEGDPRYTMGFVVDVLEVLERHGFERYDDRAGGAAVSAIFTLVEAFEGRRDSFGHPREGGNR